MNSFFILFRAQFIPWMKPWKRQLNSAAGGAQKVRHLPRQRELISLFQANKLCSKAEANSLKVATLVIKTR
jgi:hypothetical protein